MADVRMRLGALMMMMAAAALAACGGGSGAMTAGPEAPTPRTDEAPPPPPPVVDSERAGEPTTMDGVYTAAQAARGRQVYETVCVDCHNTEDWVEDGFRERWNGESVWRFWHYIWEQMPNGEPPYSLPREQVTDVVTYILQLNEVPAGTTELGSDDDSLDVHWLVFPGMGLP